MRRGFKPAIVALGAVAAIPAVIILTEPKNDHAGDLDYRKHKRAKHELWREDAVGFFQNMADRLYSLGGLKPRESVPEGRCNTIHKTRIANLKVL